MGRRELISQLEHNFYDVVVIGGGINGVAIADRAARKGFKVALLEKNDFASGTSSKSTKLMHGGLRYLETFEFGLVQESLKERTRQLRKFPKLVKPLPFIIPVYKTSPRPLWLIKMGVFLYDFLSGAYLIEKSKYLNVEEIEALIPTIQKEGLLGGIKYYDAQMDDKKLCLENLNRAVRRGVCAVNHIEVTDFINNNGQTEGVKAFDVLGESNFIIKAKKIICAAGPWSNILLDKEKHKITSRIRTTKGVHLIFRGLVSEQAVLLQSQEENRIFFVIPWGNNSLVGTTDTDFQGSPDNVNVEQEDVDYLLKEVQRFFPKQTFCKENISESFAGLRPLVYQKGLPSKVSRKHIIEESKAGVIYVMGGKYTIYQKMAEETVDLLEKS